MLITLTVTGRISNSATRSILNASRSDASNSAKAPGKPGKGSGNAVEIAPGGLFIRNPDANGKYLYETRPEFVNHGNWITSAYLCNAELDLPPGSRASA